MLLTTTPPNLDLGSKYSKKLNDPQKGYILPQKVAMSMQNSARHHASLFTVGAGVSTLPGNVPLKVPVNSFFFEYFTIYDYYLFWLITPLSEVPLA